jgi:topoisomerase-4 subunit A
MVVYLNLDAVIKIIREEEEPKPRLIKRFRLTEAQAEAILNMRLRSLRKLEEMEIRREIKELESEQKDLNRLLRDEKRRWARIGEEIADVRKRFGQKTELGARRTEIGSAPTASVVPLAALVEREPITVICSQKGWIRSAKGHVADAGELKYKEGDRGRFVIHAQTTDKILLLGTDGRFYTLAGDKLPGGRGHGEPVRLMIDMGNDQDVVALFVHVPGRKLLVAASDGRGFIAPEDEALAQTRAGKQVLNVSGDVEARACAVVEGDHVAVVGENHKLVVFPLSELPEMTRGRGVRLQVYKNGGFSDVKVFVLKNGLSWKSGDRTRTETDLRPWLGKRAQAGRLAPKGFPKFNRFSGL